MIHKIEFENYKAFKKRQVLELRPITIIIGKNNSGKSAVLRLVEILWRSLVRNGEQTQSPLVLRSRDFDENLDFDFGGDFLDLVYKRNTKPLSFAIDFDGEVEEISHDGHIIKTLDIEIRYYSNINNSIIEKYQIQVDKEIMTLELDTNTISDNPNFYFGVVNSIAAFKSIPIFSGINLVESTYFIDDVHAISDDMQPMPLEVDIKYQPPLRPKIKRDCNIHSVSRTNTTPLALYEDSKLLQRVSDWYKSNMGLNGITANREGSTNIFNINAFLADKNISIHISETGKGIEQSLPIVVDALSERKDIINIVEQPELHLHPAAQAALGQLFAESAKENPDAKFLIETHSENLILRLRRLVAEGFLLPSQLAIYSVEYDAEAEASNLKPITVDEWGNVDYWPEGVFSESLEEVKELNRVQYEQKKKKS